MLRANMSASPSLYPIFLSLVLPWQGQPEELRAVCRQLCDLASTLVVDYEIVVVLNGVQPGDLNVLTGPDGLPNLQVFSLVREVEQEVAAWAGIENALGDLVMVLGEAQEATYCLPQMLQSAASGHDIVFASNQMAQYPPFFAFLRHSFVRLYGHNPKDDQFAIMTFRLISRRVVNELSRQAHPYRLYRHLNFFSGFSRQIIEYQAPRSQQQAPPFQQAVLEGIELLVSTSRWPLRMAATLCLMGAAANILYSFYVIIVALFNRHVVEGWTSLSLQQSGMFLLISLVLLILCEYIINIGSLSEGKLPYSIAQEWTSMHMERRERINVEVAQEELQKTFLPNPNMVSSIESSEHG